MYVKFCNLYEKYDPFLCVIYRYIHIGASYVGQKKGAVKVKRSWHWKLCHVAADGDFYCAHNVKVPQHCNIPHMNEKRLVFFHLVKRNTILYTLNNYLKEYYIIYIHVYII